MVTIEPVITAAGWHPSGSVTVSIWHSAFAVSPHPALIKHHHGVQDTVIVTFSIDPNVRGYVRPSLFNFRFDICRENVQHFFECYCEVFKPVSGPPFISKKFPKDYDNTILKTLPDFTYPCSFDLWVSNLVYTCQLLREVFRIIYSEKDVHLEVDVV